MEKLPISNENPPGYFLQVILVFEGGSLTFFTPTRQQMRESVVYSKLAEFREHNPSVSIHILWGDNVEGICESAVTVKGKYRNDFSTTITKIFRAME